MSHERRRSRRRQRRAAKVVASLIVAGLAVGTLWVIVKIFGRDIYVVNEDPEPTWLYFNYRSAEEVPHGVTHLTLAHSRFALAIGSVTNSWLQIDLPANAARREENPTWVLNTGDNSIIMETQGGGDAARPPRLIQIAYGQGLTPFAHVERPFKHSPKGNPGDPSLSIYRGDPSALLEPLEQGPGVEKALAFAEWRLQAWPSDETMPRAYSRLAVRSNQSGRAKAFLAKGLERRPVNIEWHRAFIALCGTQAEIDTETAAYDRILTKRPGDSAILFLRAMLDSNLDARRSLLERSVTADAANVYAQEALGMDSYQLGLYEEAERAFQAVNALSPKRRDHLKFQIACEMILGRFDAAESILRAELKDRPLNFESALFLCDLLAIKNDTSGTASVVRDFHSAAHTTPSPDVAAEADELDWTELYLRGEFERLELKTARVSSAFARRLHFQALIELARLEEAEKEPRNRDATTDAAQQLALGLAWLGLGQSHEDMARQAFSRANGSLSKVDPRAAALLVGTAPTLDEIKAIRLTPVVRSLFLAALATKSEVLRAKLFDDALTASGTRLFPHQLIVRAASVARR